MGLRPCRAPCVRRASGADIPGLCSKLAGSWHTNLTQYCQSRSAWHSWTDPSKRSESPWHTKDDPHPDVSRPRLPVAGQRRQWQCMCAQVLNPRKSPHLCSLEALLPGLSVSVKATCLEFLIVSRAALCRVQLEHSRGLLFNDRLGG